MGAVVMPPPTTELDHTMGALPMPVPINVVHGPRRIGGTTQLVPDEATRKAMAARQLSRITATWKLCLDTKGKVTAVAKLKSSGFASYDHVLEAAIHDWVYTPYEIDGRAVPVCTAASFVYKL
jgi:hypothetical protein